MELLYTHPRWWSLGGKTVILLLMIATFYLPCLSTDEHLKHTYANIKISYIDPVTKVETSKILEGLYGMKSVVGAVSGTVMQTESVTPDRNKNFYGCTKYTNKIPSENWIALVERGRCPFTTKIEIATQDYNARAVVIYNNSSSNYHNTIMDHKASASVAVFISQESGLLTSHILNTYHPVNMQIWPGRTYIIEHWRTHNKTNMTVSFSELMIICLAGLAFYYIRCFC